MPIRYFTKHVFADRHDTAVEIDVGEGWLPMTPEKARALLQKSRAIAVEAMKDVTITLWMEKEDGTQEEIIIEQ